MSPDIEDFRVPDKPPEPPAEFRPNRDVKTPDGIVGLPANTDAERTILGAILLDNAALGAVQERLVAEDFSLDSNQRIFTRMVDLQSAGSTIDMITLAYQLRKNAEEQKVGGVAYIASLTEGLPRRPVIEEYVKIVKDMAQARRLMYAWSAGIARLADHSELAPDVASSIQEIISEITHEASWRRPEEILVSATDFASEVPKSVDWAVWGVIQRGGNGIVAADGKTGKSLLAIHLALHAATGTDWLGLTVPKPMQVALISREDDPGETARRIASFVAGSASDLRYIATLDEWFWLSTRAQMPTFMLENKKEVREIIEALKFRKVELAFFDVFRSLWSGDENDAKEVSKVLEVLRDIQREVGCSVVLLHHLNKGESANPFQKLRGSTAISGWWEWGMGIHILNQEDDVAQWVRQIRFQTKAARAHSRMTDKICGPEEAMRIELCDPPQRPQAAKSRKSVSQAAARPQAERGMKNDD